MQRATSKDGSVRKTFCKPVITKKHSHQWITSKNTSLLKTAMAALLVLCMSGWNEPRTPTPKGISVDDIRKVNGEEFTSIAMLWFVPLCRYALAITLTITVTITMTITIAITDDKDKGNKNNYDNKNDNDGNNDNDNDNENGNEKDNSDNNDTNICRQ